MDVRFVPGPRRTALSQFSRYKAEVVDRRDGTALETTSLRVALTIADLLNDDETGELAPPRAHDPDGGRYEHLVNEPWCLVVYLRDLDATETARSRDAALAARAARLLQRHVGGPLQDAKRPKSFRWWPGI